MIAIIIINILVIELGMWLLGWRACNRCVGLVCVCVCVCLHDYIGKGYTRRNPSYLANKVSGIY